MFTALRRRLKCLCLVTACCCGCSACQMPPEQAKAQVKQAYESWIAAVTAAKGNPESVVKLYAPDAILIPTLSPYLHFNAKNQIATYFRAFTALPDLQASTEQLVVRVIGKIAVASGIYRFSYTEGHETRQATARFTFVYERRDGKWLIIEHHSSVPPTTDIEKTDTAKSS